MSFANILHALQSSAMFTQFAVCVCSYFHEIWYDDWIKDTSFLVQVSRLIMKPANNDGRNRIDNSFCGSSQPR
ncbi:MAG: hypothetical protein CMI59_14065 [Parvibaculum sp.]|nr:hypothetical protein [Parvibaculum sp.]